MRLEVLEFVRFFQIVKFLPSILKLLVSIETRQSISSLNKKIDSKEPSSTSTRNFTVVTLFAHKNVLIL
jgi:hypothetical protein